MRSNKKTFTTDVAVSMLHKIVEPGKTDDKCNFLLKYSCYACHQDKLFSTHTLDKKDSLP